ncbi:tail fiber [Pseudomonas phage U1B]|nr:tail fiber [Pseudomonas phage T2P]QYV99337.1 tail fiber [Pseudomonas phage U1B]QYV99793.1 tail fiber [Pseudomonas phage U5]BBI55758.1 phage tail fiber protein [Pseudomonas phage PA02]
MASAFEDYVNGELPKRVSSIDEPTSVVNGHIPVSTGVGLNTTFVDPVTIPGLKGEDGQPGKDGEQGPPGPVGPAINIIANVDLATFEQDIKPLDTHNVGDAWFVEDRLWVWESPLGNEDPPVKGRWVETGSLRGPDGTGLVIRGRWPNNLELPKTESNKPGDAYSWNNQLWAWMLISGNNPPENPTIDDYDWFPVTPQGERGPEGPEGPQGKDGEIGPEGPQGEPAMPFTIKDSLPSPADLPDPSVAKESEAYLVTMEAGKPEHLFIFVKGAWSDLGTFQGPEGPQGKPGNTGDPGPDGKQGEPGPQGRNLEVVKAVETADDLLTTTGVEQYQGVSVRSTNTVYVLTGQDPTVDISWTAMGSFRGPQGPEGPQGEDGEQGLPGEPGAQGKSAFQVALDNGFTGTEGEWLISLHGKNVVITGAVANEAALPADAPDQAAYFTQDTSTLFVKIDGNWVNSGTHRGPKGEDGAPGKDGDQGPEGPEGPEGPQGPAGEPIQIIAAIDTPEDTPPEALADNQWKAYTVKSTGEVFVNMDGSRWTSIGIMAGPQGKPGEGLNIKGVLTDASQLPKKDTDPDLVTGDSYWVETNEGTMLYTYQGQEIDGYIGPINLNGEQGIQGVEGPQGPEGKQGGGLLIIYVGDDAGKPVASADNVGKGIAIRTNTEGQVEVFVSIDTEGTFTWESLGVLAMGPQGPEGPEGKQGVPGIPGKTGQKGERGSSWVILPEGQTAPTSIDGNRGDWCIDKTGTVWYKDANWVVFYKLMSVPVSEVDPEDVDKKMVRYKLGWTELPVDEVVDAEVGVFYGRRKATADGAVEWTAIELPTPAIDAVPSPVVNAQYVRKGIAGGETEWATITFPEIPSDVVRDTAQATKPQGRVAGNWVDVAPLQTDDTLMGMQNGEWVAVPAAVIGEVPSEGANGTNYVREKTASGSKWTPVTIIVDQADATSGQLFLRNAAAKSWTLFQGPNNDVTADGDWLRSRTGTNITWKKLDKSFDAYSLKSSTFTGTALTLTPANQQCYRVQTAANQTITLENGPVDRMITAVLVLLGKVAMPTLSSAVLQWNNGTPVIVDDLGDTKTVLTLLWDGTNWIVSKGAVI